MDQEETLSEKEQRLLIVFRQAIEDERRAQETYSEALTITDDPMLLAVFTALRDDEARHEQELTERYAAFKQRFLSSAHKG